MKMLFTGLLVAAGISLQAQATPAADSVYLSGTIKNAAKYLDSVHAVEVVVREPVSFKHTRYRAPIKPDGTYRVAFVKTAFLDVELSYNDNYTNVLLQPGNHLQIDFDADHFSTLKFTGDNAQTNRELAAYRTLQNQQNQTLYGTEEGAYFITVSRRLQSEQPQAYREFLRNRYLQDSNLLNRYIKEQHPGDEFVQWARADLQCNYYDNVMRYAWLHPRANHINEQDFKLPDGYFNFLQAKNFISPKLALSSSYPRLMREYSAHLIWQSSKQPDAPTKTVETFLALPKGMAKDVLLCEMLHDKIREKQVAKLAPYKKRIEQSMSTVALKALFNQEYEAAMQQQANYTTPSNHTAQAAPKTGAEKILGNLTDKYRGKLVYIDFWATWCSPCLAEMPFSKKLSNQYAGKDVVFLYLGSLCEEKDWQQMTADLKLTGEHVFLNEDDFHALSQKFQFDRVPRYMLLDKTGRVIDADARRPSDDKLPGDIDKLLALK